MKNLFTESLECKVLKYSIAASAVLFGTKKTEATVIHHASLNLTNVSQFSIDFDGSGAAELTVKAYPNVGVAQNDVDIYPGKVEGILYSGLYHVASVLNSSVSIGPGGNFSNGNSQRLIANSYGQWKGATEKFLGVKFTGKDGQTHYGWVRLSCSATQGGTGGYLLSVFDYSYESSPNTAINSGTLPVELTTFTANNLGDKIELKWNTSTEVNNYGFNVERKTDAGSWMNLGFVEGNGTSNLPKDYSFVDSNPVSGKIEYRLKQIDNDGSFKYSRIVTVNSLPTKFELWQNYPNPFNPTTTIQYAIPKAEHVTLKVYDELGNEVSTLVDEKKEAGQYNVQFNGGGLASGIYYYRITAGEFNEVKKLMLLK